MGGTPVASQVMSLGDSLAKLGQGVGKNGTTGTDAALGGFDALSRDRRSGSRVGTGGGARCGIVGQIIGIGLGHDFQLL
ncbi:MAG: hypothetical protein BWY75_00867 [bacterium ADurb.Bin425]|nr:MAG: hypothetical protein BWY75_00867 [bacterium ADurb.Bin425]